MAKSGTALVIFSGGQDSTTCLFWALERFASVHCLTFDYGQRHRVEIDSARRIAELASVSHEVIDMGPIFAGISPLTDLSKKVAKYAGADALPGGLENTFVPGRNILFLTVAANRAYVLNADNLVLGVAQEDFGGYPDCRQDFIEKMEAALSSGLGKPLKLLTPLMNLTKRETVDLAMSLPGCIDALAHSTTCYEGAVPPCLKCHSCLLRCRGFEEAGIADPLLERLKSGAIA